MIQFDRNAVAPFMALRNAAGIAIPLLAGFATGTLDYGVVASMSALNVSYSDGDDPYRLRSRRMLAATILSAVAIVAGSLSGAHPAAAIALGACWAMGAGLLVALSASAANIGLLSLILVLVYSGKQMPPMEAMHAGFAAFAGGLLQIALSLTPWPICRNEPELRVLRTFYLELSRMTSGAVPPTAAPPASQRATAAYSALSHLSRSHSVHDQRLLSLLAQAERIRLSILMLGRVRVRWSRDPSAGDRVLVLEECFRITSGILANVASLLSGGTAPEDAASPGALRHAAERLQSAAEAGSPRRGEFVREAQRQLEALASQLRSALELAASSTEDGQVAFERAESMRPWRLRLQGTVATLLANATFRSPALRHAVRLSAAVLAGEAAAYLAGGVLSYWLPMTVAIVLKPDFTATFSRGVLRLAGTLAGLILATALFYFAVPTPLLGIAYIFVAAFLLRCYGSANYGILAMAVSALIVLLASIAGNSPEEVIAQRGWHTLWGGMLALAAYLVWPTWERSQVNQTLGELLDAYRVYFRAVRQNYIRRDGRFDDELNRTRIGARLARSNAEASLDRFSSEPGATATATVLVEAVLASSNRFIHAVMALEAGLVQSHPATPPPAFAALARKVEATLHSLAAALRGAALTREMLPDLKRAQRTPIQSGDALQDRHALLNVEMDRIVNLADILADQVLELPPGMAGARRGRPA